jgi:hypothetical protein
MEQAAPQNQPYDDPTVDVAQQAAFDRFWQTLIPRALKKAGEHHGQSGHVATGEQSGARGRLLTPGSGSGLPGPHRQAGLAPRR